MDDTDKADELLKQIPLLKNPAFQPPKPVTLNHNYHKLLPNLQQSVPPKINVDAQELERWQAHIDSLQSKVAGLGKQSAEAQQFTKWLSDSQRKVAPGFMFGGGVMQPSRRVEKQEPEAESINEIDRMFSSTKLS
ncbi:hypothetical protein DIRU0_B08350 [Diutina rugosa]